MVTCVAACLAVATAMSPTAPGGAGTVRAEPGALLLPDRPTLQAVVADMRGIGTPDVVRLVQDGDGGPISLEVWRQKGPAWGMLGDIEVVPAAGRGPGDVVFGGAPARLVVRDVGKADHVTLVRQPQLPPPGTSPPCCLQLHDVLVVAHGGLELVPVGSDRAYVDAILALDLDGDGTDEILASRSLPPLGRTAYPSEALVFRWQGERFGQPTLTELPIGSGDAPFVLGETDGRPGDEAAVITTAARSVLYRLSMDDSDRVRAESAGRAVRAVAALALDDGPAVATISPIGGLEVARWPAGAELDEALGAQPMVRGRLLGSVRIDGRAGLLVEEEDGGQLRAFTMPDLEPITGWPPGDGRRSADSTPASVRPFRGLLPGGDAAERRSVIADGWLLRAGRVEPVRTVAFGGATPIGFAGEGRGWMAIAHGLAPGAPLDPAGGRLAGMPPASGSVSLAPVDHVVNEEADGGILEPEIRDAVPLARDGRLGVAGDGLRFAIEAPSGSRVHAGLDEDVGGTGLHRVPAGGRIEIHVPLPAGFAPSAAARLLVGVVTPAGATYRATVDVVALTGPPPLAARARTALGSTAVAVEGETVAHATVEVDGRAVSVDQAGRFSAQVDVPPWPTSVSIVARDPLGNEARTQLSAIGLLDYRSLPWTPIVVALVAVAAVALVMRVPGASTARRRFDDGAALEELDPDERIGPG